MHLILIRIFSGVGLLSVLFGSTLFKSAALAQSAPTLPPTAPDAVQETIPRPVDRLPAPPAPPAASPPPLQTLPAPAPPAVPNGNIRFPIQRIEVEGSTVLQPEIAAIVQEYEARRELSFEDLLELRSRITQLYIDRGYVTSGAFLPNNQVLTDGIVRIQVIEGTLEAIQICLLAPGANQNSAQADAAGAEQSQASAANGIAADPESQQASDRVQEISNFDRCGSARLPDRYVRDRLAQTATQPVNQQQIESALQLLQINPLIQQVNAELIAGSAPGRSVLLVQVRENSPFRLSVGADNYQSPSIGSEQLTLQAAYSSLLVGGDRISGGYGITRGLDSFDIGYAIPINALDGTLSLSYSRDASLIVEEEFRDFNIESRAQTFSIGLRQPLIREPGTEFALGIQADLRRSTTFVAGQPFTFGRGPENGQSNVTVLRFSQDWLERNAQTVLAARSQFSFGIDAFDATVNDSGTDGRFVAWLGQFQWVQRFSDRGVLVSRVAAQLTPDSLLSLERFGFGGIGTVRGYRQNQLVTDNGVLAGLEVRVALLPDSNRLQLIPFAEIAHGWNNGSPDPSTPTLASVGLGLRWAITPNLAIGVDYGIPLIGVENQGNSLQDNGLYFSVRYQPL